MFLPLVSRRWPDHARALLQTCTQQRRRMTGKVFRKYGPKYQAKIDAADKMWEEQEARIKTGEQQSMWALLQERGFIKDVAGNPAEIENLMNKKRIGAYVGIDPTAPSMHVGHLLPFMPLFWMYMHGFRSVTLLGGATGKIGDPTGRLKTREDLQSATVTMNMVKIHYQLKKLWANVDEQARRYGYERTWAWRRGVLQNSHWWNKLPMLEVLQRLGAGMRLGPMLSRDTVKRKMTEGDGMSFAEFSYPLLQAWDWWHMYTKQGVQMQIGGSDQYGNIVTGIDAFKIIRASEPNPALKLPTGPMHDPVGFTVPLLTDSSGVKFGKSTGNAIWLDRFATTPFDLYGYFMRRPDADVERLLRLFTFLPMDAIHDLMVDHEADPARRVAQHTLAYEVVFLVHGKQLAEDARTFHHAMYRDKKATVAGSIEAGPQGLEAGAVVTREQPAYSEDIPEKDEIYGPPMEPLTLNNAPQVDLQLPESLLRAGKVARILYAAGLVQSVSDGNRVAVQKGAYVGASPGQVASVNKGMLLTQVDFTPVHLWFPEDTKNFIIGGKYMVLRKGRHNVRIIEMVSDDEYEASGQSYPGQPNTGKVRKLREQLRELKQGLTNKQLSADLKNQDTSNIIFPGAKPARVVQLEHEIRNELRKQMEEEEQEQERKKKEKRRKKEEKKLNSS